MLNYFRWLFITGLLLFVACNQQVAPILAGPELPDETLLAMSPLELLSPAALEVVEVTASAHDGNVPQNTLDGNLGTRWSALGDGQWLRFDLGTPQPIGAVKIAFYVGDVRFTYFDLETSSDGATWTQVYSGQSSGTTREHETFNIPDTSARYLRIVGHKNSLNEWNSLTEVVIQGESGIPELSVTASAHDGNVPENTLDGNLGTRWSALGDGQWIRYDLDEMRSVGALKIAFYRGDRRVTYFDIETSLNGSSWTRVFTGESSGTTKMLETFTFSETDARYLRIVGHKNSESSWISLTEVEIHGGGAGPVSFTSTLVAQHSGKCMDVYRAQLAPGTKIIQYSCNGNDNQSFTFHSVADQTGAYTLRGVSSALCLEVSVEQRYEGNPVLVQNGCSGEAKQIFTLQRSGPASDKVFGLIAKHSGQCVDVAKASLENRAQLVADSCHTGASQQWYIADFKGEADAGPAPIPRGDNDVAPIRWSKFTRGNPGSTAALNLRTATLNANKFLLTTWWNEVKNFDAQSGTYLDFGGRSEHQIRHPAAAAVSLAVSLETNIYDTTRTGVSASIAKARALSLIRSLAYRHRATSSPGWGRSWQSPLWAHKVGLAAWLVWDDLSSTEQSQVRAMLESEANRLVGYRAPYYRDLAGNLLSSGNTRAEENAWNASLLHLAVTMMPEHPQRHAWQYKNLELKASSYAQPSDLSVSEPLHGRPVKDWLYGSNAYDDGVVINHARVHPDYMVAIEHNLEGAIVSSLAGQATPLGGSTER